MLSYSHADLSVNPGIPEVYVGPEIDSPPVPDTPGCQVRMFNGCSEFKHSVSTFRPPKPIRGDRAAITKFSPRSRRNLLKKLFSLSIYPSLFITLTYPNFYPADSSEWKRHLGNFHRRLIELYPNSWFFWKLEPQKRGAPHYHLIGRLNDDKDISILRDQIAELWYQVCGSIDEKHLRAGTNVKLIHNSKKKMLMYVCKYIGKVDTTEYESWIRPGRFWGILGRKKNLPPAIATVFNMDKAEYFVLRRLIRRWLKSLSPKSRKYSKRLANIPSFFVLIPREIMDRFLDLVLGEVPFEV